jgi:hypothetical protein
LALGLAEVITACHAAIAQAFASQASGDAASTSEKNRQEILMATHWQHGTYKAFSRSPRSRWAHAVQEWSYRPQVEQLEERALLSVSSLGPDALRAAYGQLPLAFEANQGQTDAGVQFLARGTGYALFLTSTEAVLHLGQPSAEAVVTARLLGGNPSPQVAGLDQLTSVSNYLIGQDPSGWHGNVPTYARVQYQNVYPGIDLIYYGNQGQLEYDFVLAPGADPHLIHLSFTGVEGLALDSQGDLLLHTGAGDLVEHAPVLYQDGAGGRQAIDGRYIQEGPGQVGFQVGPYDTSRSLVIDPTLVYSSLFGGSMGDYANAIAVDAAGNTYVAGYTFAADFPTTPGGFQTSFGPTFFQATRAFVAKLNPGGTALVYATYLGGSGVDRANALAVDAAGDVYVTGSTQSPDFPTTAGAFQTTYGKVSGTDAFVTELDPTGATLLFSSYLRGSQGSDSAQGIAVDPAGNAYVAGFTSSGDFPTTAGAFQTILQGMRNAFVTQVNATGSALVYSTFLGGGDDTANGITVDGTGNAYVAGSTTSANFPTTVGAFQTTFGGGSDAFVTKLNATGTALVYSSFLGGTGTDVASGIAVDGAGNAYLTGSAGAAFPTTAGSFGTLYGGGASNAFVAKVNPTGSALVYATYLPASSGSQGGDSGNAIAVDAGGNATITGRTLARNFPTTSGAFQVRFPGQGSFTGFVTRMNATGSSLLYSTYLGGSGDPVHFQGDVGNGIALDAAGNIYVTGAAVSADFPVTPGAYHSPQAKGNNVFVAKINPAPFVPLFAIGGAPGRVLVYKPDNSLLVDFAPFGSAYTGPINVAVGDINGDGYYDLVAAAAAGNPDVRVFDGKAIITGTFDPANPGASLLAQWFPYGLNFNIGATVAVGDIDHDGYADIVTGASAGNPDVRVYRGRDIAQGMFNPTGPSLLAQWFPYALQFNVGVNVAVGDVNGDGFADVVTGPTAGNPDVRIYRGRDIVQGMFNPVSSLQAQWFAYGLNFNVGAFVAVGDVNGDGYGDVITGATAGNPHVKVYDGKAISQGTFSLSNPDAGLLDQFFAYDLQFNVGAAVAAADFENTGQLDILTGASRGAPHYRVVKGNATGVKPPALFERIIPDIQGGISVGA